ncbi:MAG: methyltransferase domain-containing protein, partial [Planctomycetota bacterium]
KGKEGECWEHREAVIYKGPWKQVVDDDGHVLRRGERTAVCRKTYEIMTRAPYADAVQGVEPLVPVSAEDAQPFDCSGPALRDPAETKQGAERADVAPGCGDTSCC